LLVSGEVMYYILSRSRRGKKEKKDEKKGGEVIAVLRWLPPQEGRLYLLASEKKGKKKARDQNKSRKGKICRTLCGDLPRSFKRKKERPGRNNQNKKRKKKKTPLHHFPKGRSRSC